MSGDNHNQADQPDLWSIRTTSSGAFDRIKAGRDMARGRWHTPRADRVRWFRW